MGLPLDALICLYSVSILLHSPSTISGQNTTSPLALFHYSAFNRIKDLACAWKTSKYFKNASVSAGTSACETNVLGSISATFGIVGRSVAGDRGRAVPGEPGRVSRERARGRGPRPGEVERLRWTTASSCLRSCLTPLGGGSASRAQGGPKECTISSKKGSK